MWLKQPGVDLKLNVKAAHQSRAAGPIRMAFIEASDRAAALG
jgi:hypothetical protein